MNRGKIRNEKYAKQLRDFNGLKFGNITPTDIDGFIDFKNKVFIFLEFKYSDSEIPFGQKLALERLCDTCSLKNAYVIICSHNNKADEQIDTANSIVKEVRFLKKWNIVKARITLYDYIKLILNKLDMKYENKENKCHICGGVFYKKYKDNFVCEICYHAEEGWNKKNKSVILKGGIE